MQYIKRPAIIEATQWFKKGDHPEVYEYSGKAEHCWSCGHSGAEHGSLTSGHRDFTVCPGDYITSDAGGVALLRCKFFEEQYEKFK
jgi:hypothetical protein